jgi:hypothetical protein
MDGTADPVDFDTNDSIGKMGLRPSQGFSASERLLLSARGIHYYPRMGMPVRVMDG